MKKYFAATVGTEFEQYVREKSLGIELDFFCTAENLKGEKYDSCCAEIERLMKDCRISGDDMILHAPFNELHPAAIDEEALLLAKKRMRQSYSICEKFGIKKMVVHSGYLPFVYFKSWHIEKSVEFWHEFMKGKPGDFTICIENVLEDEPYMIADMMEKINEDGQWPNIGICVDIGHANCMSKEDIYTWIRVLSPYIKHMHIHNNDGEHDLHASFDTGTMDIESVLNFTERICMGDITYTSEVIDCGGGIAWLERKGYLK